MKAIDEGLKQLLREEWLNDEEFLALAAEDWEKEEEDGELCLRGETP